MTVIIYGDFNCPYSYLASQRAGLLGQARIAVDWRAVEHAPGLPMTGSRPDSDLDAWNRELAAVASLALPGEHVPVAPPTLISNTEAAVAAYAEAVSDGVAGELRASLFRAIWARGLHVSSAYEVRRLVTSAMWPREDVTGRLGSPDFPSLLLRDSDITRVVRRSGGTIALNGVPLTTAGWRRIRQWRQEWLALTSQVIPAIIGDDQVERSGTEGLTYLAGLLDTAGPNTAGPNTAGPNTAGPLTRLSAHSRTAPGRDTRRVPVARAA